MKLLKKYLALFVALSLGGMFYLRWLALEFLYRTMDKYWSGIGATVSSTLALLVVVSFFIAKRLFEFERLASKASGGQDLSPEERARALGAYKAVNTLSIVTNVAGFFVGQIAVLIIEYLQGSLVVNWPRLVLTVIQAAFVGSIAALFEIYMLNNWMAGYRRLLRIRDVDDFGSEGRTTISGRISLTATVAMVFMGVNAFCAAFALVLGTGAPAADPMAAYLRSGALAIAATLVPCLLLLRIITTELRGRVSDLSDRVRNLGDEGDLSSRIDLAMNDDLGALTSRLNGFLDQLSSLIASLQDETRTVADRAQVLSESSDSSKLALANMQASVDRIVGEGDRQNREIAAAHTDIQGLAENAKDVEQQVLVQSAAIEQSSASVNEMAANVNSVAELAGKAESLSSRLRESSVGGEASIRQAVGAIAEIQASSREVQSSVQDIQKIASQTNLLSMNAAIEAAHAGDAGRGFAVVASEVGVLASSSSKSARGIQEQIKSMSAKIDNGVAAISAAGKAFAEISAGIGQTSDLIDTISSAMDEQRIGAKETMQSTVSVVEAIDTIKRLASRQREFTERMAAAMNALVASSKEIDLALRENADNSASLDGAVRDVGACVVDANQAIKRMEKQMGVFRL